MKKNIILSICTMGIVSILFTGCCIVHEWQDADCTNPITCAKCGKTKGEALGHDWQEATCTEPKTCAVCGEKEGNPLGHDWREATCTEPKTCAVCGEKEGNPLGHDWQEATCTEPATCSICGETEGEAIGHLWLNATCTEPAICSVCGETEGEALGHDLNAMDICNRCGEYTGEGIAYTYDDGILTIFGNDKLTYDAWSKAQEKFGTYDGPVEELIITGHITGIDKYFWGNRSSYYVKHTSNLTKLTIADSVTGAIEEGAFYQQDNLTDVYIGNGITSIGRSVFMSASYLQNIYIGDSCKTIDSFAFAYCNEITSFSVPADCSFKTSGDNSAFFNGTLPAITYR